MAKWIKDYGSMVILAIGSIAALVIWTVHITVTAETAELSNRVNSNEQNLTTIGQGISNMKTEIGNIKTDVGYIRERLGRVETGISWIRDNLQDK